MAVWWLETSRQREPEDLPCRRTELEEGDVILNELPEHIQNPTGWVQERVMGIQLPRIVAVAAVLSKN